jgi:hypothetical protein
MGKKGKERCEREKKGWGGRTKKKEKSFAACSFEETVDVYGRPPRGVAFFVLNIN